MQKIIEAENLGFSYGGEPIFSNISFTVTEGDFVAVIGSNGTGKSTLLRLLLGELTPSAGHVRLFGEDAARFRNWPKIGYVMQAAAQRGASFPATVEEIVTANLYSQIGLFRFPRREHRELTREALAQVGMNDCSKRLFYTLSGGQQQRVLLARVLVNKPEIMLLDEPATGIDAQTTAALYELLARLNRETGLTVVMVTHDLGRSSEYATRVLCLEDGLLHELGQAEVSEELSHKHKHPWHRHTAEEKGLDNLA
jgi:zinc transport system ATP-binding protein